MLLMIIIGSIPTAIIGVLLKSTVEESLTSLLMVGIALLVTGTLLYLCDSLAPATTRTEISYLDALIIGTIQGIAVLPGISRSGSTISGGILRGLDRKIAAKYSFLLSIPAILGAVVLEGKDILSLSQTPQLIPYLLGMLTAFVIGYLAIAALIKVVVQKKLSWFAVYCWVVGGFAVLYGLLK
jgi:undecaprenyl-diphosphatase